MSAPLLKLPNFSVYYGPVQACVSASGPYGYVSGSVCI